MENPKITCLNRKKRWKNRPFKVDVQVVHDWQMIAFEILEFGSLARIH